MGEWTEDNFGNEGARDYLSMMTSKLVATIKDVMSDDERLEPDEDGESLLMPSIAILALLCESCNASDKVGIGKAEHVASYDQTCDKNGAAGDSLGLWKQYNDHKSNYQWGPSAGVIIFNCNNKATADNAIASLKKGKPWKQVVADADNNIQADSGRYEISQLPLTAGVKATEGLITEPIANTPDGATGFIQIVKLFDGNQPRTFTEARGLVINDYQNVLEERWVDELKKRYPVKVNEGVFQSMLK